MKSFISFLTKNYYGSFVIVFGLLLISGSITYKYLDHQSKVNSAIQKIDKQNMLTQRISSLSSQYMMRNKSVLEDLKVTIQEFKENNEALLGVYNTSVIPKSNLKSIYHGTGVSFNNQIEIYLESVDKFLKTSLRSRKSRVYFNKVIAQSNLKLLESFDLLEIEYQKNLKKSRSLLVVTQLLLGFSLLLIIGIYTFGILKPTLKNLSSSESLLAEAQHVDMLTKLLNRKKFIQNGEIEVFRSRRYSRPLSLLLIDIDHFKSFNDKQGHNNGDKMLVSFAKCLSNNVRNIDFVGRISGGEFAVLLPETNISQAVLLADRLRGIVAAENMGNGESKSLNITISVGATEVKLSNENNSIEKGLKDAAENLFFAKQAGRNVVMPKAA